MDAGENGEVRYELMRGHGELFRVQRKTGEVILKQPLESQVREYQLSIAAYDGGSLDPRDSFYNWFKNHRLKHVFVKGQYKGLFFNLYFI